MTATKLKLSRQQLKEVDRLLAEFDPGQHIPEWIRDRGASEDWAGYIQVDQYELRGVLEVAVLLGKALRQLDTRSVVQSHHAPPIRRRRHGRRVLAARPTLGSMARRGAAFSG